MIKQFEYIISVDIQNRINGKTEKLSKKIIGEVDINEETYLTEFRIADDQPFFYVQEVIMDYCNENNVNIEDLDILKFSVSSNDPDVIVYFEKANTQELIVRAPIYAYIKNPQGYLLTPGNFSGEAIDKNSIRWTWNIVEGCAYRIYNVNGDVIAHIGVGITEYIEENLTPNTNYTRAIEAYNADEVSPLSEYFTATTLPEETEEDLKPFSVSVIEDVNLTPINEPGRSRYIKSGIGEGDDLKVSISNINEETFSCTATITPCDIISEEEYNEIPFIYRQRSEGEVEKICSFGHIKGELFAFPPSYYDADIYGEVFSPVEIQRPVQLKLTAKANGPAVIQKNGRYSITARAVNQPINVKRTSNINIEFFYETSYDFDYKAEATIQCTKMVPQKIETYEVTLDAPILDAYYVTTMSNPRRLAAYRRFRFMGNMRGEFYWLMGYVDVAPVGDFKENIFSQSYERWFTVTTETINNFINGPSYGKSMYDVERKIVDYLKSIGADSYIDIVEETGIHYGLYDIGDSPKEIAERHAYGQAGLDIYNNQYPSASEYISKNSYRSMFLSAKPVNSSSLTGVYKLDYIHSGNYQRAQSTHTITLDGTNLEDNPYNFPLYTEYSGSVILPPHISMWNSRVKITFDYFTSQSTYEANIVINKSNTTLPLFLNQFSHMGRIRIEPSTEKILIFASNFKYFTNKYDVIVETGTRTYTGLKQYMNSILIWNNIENEVNAIAQTIPEIIDADEYVIKSMRAINTNAENVKTTIRSQNGVYSMYAHNITPDSFYNNAVFQKVIYTESDINNQIKITSDELQAVKLYGMQNGRKTSYLYDITDYQNIICRITSSSNPSVNAAWESTASLESNATDNIIITTGRVTGEYSHTITYSDIMQTSLTELIVMKVVTPDYNQFVLKCAEQQLDGVVETNDQIFNGDPSIIQYELKHVSGDLLVAWENSVSPITAAKENVKLYATMEYRDYVKDYIIERSISSEAGDNVLLLSKDEVAQYIPYYNNDVWPEIFGTDNITYSLQCNTPYMKVAFSNGELSSIGPDDVYISVDSNIVMFTVEQRVNGIIYSYEDGKQILKLSDMTLTSPDGLVYSGNWTSVTFTIRNKSSDAHVIIDGETVRVVIQVAKSSRKLMDIDQWVTLAAYKIPVTVKTDEAIGFIKTDGWANTCASNSIGEVNSQNGLWIYDRHATIYLYAEKKPIIIKDFAYGPSMIGIVNQGNIKQDMQIPIADLIPDATEHYLEIDDPRVSYRIENGMFIVFSVNNEHQELIPDINSEPIIAMSDAQTIKANTTRHFIIRADNPKLYAPDKVYKLELSSNNPNVILSSDIDVNTIESTEPTIDIPVTAEVAIASQTPWYPELVPGYYYLSSDEYYLFGESNVMVEKIEDNKYKVSPLPKSGSPIIVMGEDGTIFTEVHDGLEITDEAEVINNKYLKLSNTGIDVNTLLINNEVIEGVSVINNIVILPSDIFDDTIVVRYKLANSFYVEEFEDHLIITVHGGQNHSVYYETGSKYIARHIDLNPLRNSINVGFLYIKD